MDPVQYNREAWNRQARQGNRWSIPVDDDTIARARAGEWDIILTPNTPVPKAWMEPIAEKDVLCLASGGGQQAPTLAAAGAKVVSFDNSDEQLARDHEVAGRHNLPVETIQGDMADLSALADDSFDLIVHPVSNVFAKNVLPVWKECARVLREGGSLIAGIQNPFFQLFHWEEIYNGKPPVLRYSIPFSVEASLTEEEQEKWLASGDPLEYGHSLQDQIGGQIDAGLVITGLYEDDWDDESSPLNRYGPIFIATRGTKMTA